MTMNLNIRGRIMNIAKWRYKLEIFKVKKFLCVMMLNFHIYNI